jgi:ribose transport system substrate-binding protein
MTTHPDEPEAGTPPNTAPDSGVARRELIGAGGVLAALLAGCRGQGRAPAAGDGHGGGGAHAFGRPLKAAFVNAGLANSWPAQGKATTEQWGRWLGIDVTWYDGGLSIDKQRKAVDDMAAKTWDFVAIQAFGIDTLVDPVSQMIGRGIPVVQMDTIIAKNDPGVVTFLEPDNIAMAETVAETLFKALGGAGNVIMTQGALGHSGAQKRAAGFERALKRYPNVKLLAQDTAEWDVNKTAKLWEDYLVKFPKVDAAFFHSDDMALAASRVIRNAGRDVKLGSVDAMPEAISAIRDGRLMVSVRNSSARIHWGALVVGAMAATGAKDIPKYIQIDGPVVTKEIADGVAFMEANYLL